MTLTPILPTVILANVRYKWLVNGVWGAALSSGIVDTGEFGTFQIDAIPPDGAVKFMAYDATDEANKWTKDFPEEGAGAIAVLAAPSYGGVLFRDAMFAIARKMGLNPEGSLADLDDEQTASYTGFINSWVRRLWDKIDIPEWTITEQRTPVNHIISFTQNGQRVIGKMWNAYLLDPDITHGPFDIPYSLGSSGVHVGFEHGTNVWIKYMQPAPQFTSVPYDVATTYALGGLAYDETSGNVYQSIQAGNINHAVTDTMWWMVVVFPARIADLVIRGAYADALREDGQTDKASVEEQAVLTEFQLLVSSLSTGPNVLTDQETAA